MAKGKRISKKTNRIANFENFVKSGYKDLNALKKACKDDENLMIYTCLSNEELEEIIEKLQDIDDIGEKINFLVKEQPSMNASVERYNICVESIAKYLKGYINYNAFKMCNSTGSIEDWTSEFWAKYCKICDFYRTRWFFPEKLKKASTVTYSPLLYKEFIYICRMSITGERKHFAFLATQNPSSSLFKMSLDGKLDSGDGNEKTLADVVADEENSGNAMLEQANVNVLISKALEICKNYPDALEYYSQISDFYEKQDPTLHDKKTVMLAKIFLYKAGLVSPKILTFIKTLSPTYRSRYNLSSARMQVQQEELKTIKIVKTTRKKAKPEVEGWRELILKRRGEV